MTTKTEKRSRVNWRCIGWAAQAVAEDFVAAAAFTTGHIPLGAGFLLLSADSVRMASRAYYTPHL